VYLIKKDKTSSTTFLNLLVNKRKTFGRLGMKKLTLLFVILLVLLLSFPLSTIGQSNISIWFPPTQGNEVKSEIISLINSASKRLYAAVYDINDSDIVSALLSAHKKE